jgi:hypothetical protein
MRREDALIARDFEGVVMAHFRVWALHSMERLRKIQHLRIGKNRMRFKLGTSLI